MPSTQAGYVTKLRNGQIEFDLVYGRETTGIVRFIISDPDGTPVWELSGGSQNKPPKVVYGQVPVGWTQVFPAGNVAPPEIRGRRVKVRIDTRYQIPFGPGVEVNEGDVNIPQE
ncbi:hypothetical protein FRUB_04311 [Fimbriiglobus ruber]|uniref:Uncharacterized protein n=1 Tax=Fimbriiglobus ruber TaxID=1908690 RepID=A0A225DMJ1_9BACT|nr:hypothetical protein FRUB_04311 [Fimbriiglobus ruber]